jgi:hypothetical protein
MLRISKSESERESPVWLVTYSGKGGCWSVTYGGRGGKPIKAGTVLKLAVLYFEQNRNGSGRVPPLIKVDWLSPTNYAELHTKPVIHVIES